MGLAVSDEGMEAPQVCSFIGIEAEDREERGHSLSILPRERHTLLSAVKAWFLLWREKIPSPPSKGRVCRRSGLSRGQGGRQLGRPCRLLQTLSKSGKQISWDEGCGIALISVKKTTEMRQAMAMAMTKAERPLKHLLM